MSTRNHDRLLDLLAEEAVQPLGAEQRDELAQLLAEQPEIDDQELKLAAAAIELAYTEADQPLPTALHQRLERQAASFYGTETNPASPTPAPASSPTVTRATDEVTDNVRQFPARGPAPWLGWAAAAAALIAAWLGWLPTQKGPESPTTTQVVQTMPEPTPAERRAALVANRNPLRLDWTATEDPAANLNGSVAGGDVVWDTEHQEGYLRFVGLAANDPAIEQYQLWIFDGEQDERYPIDGGVFNVPSSGEVIVPINAKLRVRQPVMFAITVEKPGGVVVSGRDRIPVLAQVEG